MKSSHLCDENWIYIFGLIKSSLEAMIIETVLLSFRVPMATLPAVPQWPVRGPTNPARSGYVQSGQCSCLHWEAMESKGVEEQFSQWAHFARSPGILTQTRYHTNPEERDAWSLASSVAQRDVPDFIMMSPVWKETLEELEKTHRKRFAWNERKKSW